MDGGAAHTETGTASGRSRRWPWLTARRLRLAVILAVIALAAIFLFRFLSERAGYVATADARIASDMVAVSTDISGRITTLAVSKGDRVEAGDVIFEINRREAELALAQYQAEADRLRAEIQREEMRANLSTSKAGSEVAARRAGTLSASASVAAAMSDFETAQSDFARTEDLFARGRVTQAALDRAQNELDTAQQAVRRAEADADRALAEQRTASIAGEEVALIEYDLSVLRAALRQAEARVEAQEVVVDQHTIRSPIDGVVDELFYDVGEHSLRGFRMALVHDPDAAWVSANIKETEIRHVQPGAPVAVKIDSYPGREFEGRVTAINDSTLAEAALMPNPNANGVFTKITQRISVRIDLEAGDLPLRPGTMATVRIEKTQAGDAG